MIKNITKLEHKIGDRFYQFFCDQDSPVGEVHDALSRFKTHVVGIINSAEASEKECKKEE